MLARNWKYQWLPLCLARQASSVCKHGETRGQTNDFKSKFACILEASESTRLRMEESLPNHLRTILQDRGTIHCNKKKSQIYSYASSHEDSRSKGSSG